MRFKSREVEIEAVQFTGDNYDEVESFTGVESLGGDSGTTFQLWIAKSSAWARRLPVGTWVVKEPDGSGFYPCEDEVFQARWREA